MCKQYLCGLWGLEEPSYRNRFNWHMPTITAATVPLSFAPAALSPAATTNEIKYRQLGRKIDQKKTRANKSNEINKRNKNKNRCGWRLFFVFILLSVCNVEKQGNKMK